MLDGRRIELPLRHDETSDWIARNWPWVRADFAWVIQITRSNRTITQWGDAITQWVIEQSCWVIAITHDSLSATHWVDTITRWVTSITQSFGVLWRRSVASLS